jgi:hypothetical protein
VNVRDTFPSPMAVFKQMTKQSLQIIASGQQGNATRSWVEYVEQQVKHSNWSELDDEDGAAADDDDDDDDDDVKAALTQLEQTS